MSILSDRLKAKKVLISDGAWGTLLAARGLPPGESPEKWNIENPDAVRAVAAAYVAAGCDIILTNTFGGSPFKLSKVGLRGRLAEINRRGAEISKEAAKGRALVFASIGPTGEFMEPLGAVTPDEMVACFTEQVVALAEGGVDGVVVETMADLGEALAAIQAVKQNTDLPAILSMTFDKGANEYATMMGVRPAQAARAAEDEGADAVGANCGAGIDNMIEVARLMRPATKLPLWFKPNAGMPELINGETVFRETPDAMAAKLPKLIEAGADIVGGCCGTTPDHLKAFAQARAKMVK